LKKRGQPAHIRGETFRGDRMGRLGRLAGIAVTMLVLLGAPAQARYLRFPVYGVWMITRATPAPWTDGQYTSDPFLAQSWVGKKVIFRWDIIDAPFPLGCDAPNYRTVEVPPDGLFQGNLTSPVIQAQALGFRAGAPVTTLETDCEHIIDYHFIDRSTAMFALDNMIYTLRRR
jgi:hypothetical protein